MLLGGVIPEPLFGSVPQFRSATFRCECNVGKSYFSPLTKFKSRPPNFQISALQVTARSAAISWFKRISRRRFFPVLAWGTNSNIEIVDCNQPRNTVVRICHLLVVRLLMVCYYCGFQTDLLQVLRLQLFYEKGRTWHFNFVRARGGVGGFSLVLILMLSSVCVCFNPFVPQYPLVSSTGRAVHCFHTVAQIPKAYALY